MPMISFDKPPEFQDGIADFETMKATPARSSKNNSKMIVLDLILTDVNNTQESSRCWLMLELKKMAYFTQHYFKAINRFDDYEASRFDTDLLVGGKGKCIAKKELTENHGIQVRVKDFLFNETQSQHQSATESPFIDDVLPF